MKKRLLFLIHALNIGGAQRVLLELVNNLNFQRFDVTVQTIYDRGDLRAQLDPQVRYRAIIRVQNKYIQALESYCIRRIVTPDWTYRTFIDDDYDYAIAFLEGECTRLIGGCKNTRTKKFAWVHADFANLFSANGVYKNIEEHLQTYKQFDQIVCVSDGVRKGFCKRFGCNLEEKLVVKYNVIDGERICAAATDACEESFPKDVFQIISIGNMRKEKGYDRLLRICRKMADTEIRFHLTIIGGGNEFDAIKELQNKLRLENYVTLLGHKSNPYKYLKQADMFLQASYTEAFSTVLIEAILLGIPSMVTECSGMKEILDDGKYGLIIPNNEESIEKNLKKVIDDPTILDIYRERLPERKDFFDKSRSLREITSLFDT